MTDCLVFPLELFFWTWRYCPPTTLLAFTQCSKRLPRFLVNSPRSDAIWANSRKCYCGPDFPGPPPSTSEFQNVSLIFGVKPCYICQSPNAEFPFSYALKIKLCEGVCTIISSVHATVTSICYRLNAGVYFARE
ncbi:hypothetical protein M422DRAFT_28663 [Sphaerobolus stellatus SS14]|uniref:Uncharacterized protein n=1 Tax=Sphaerobolus stellatus (strain SS14) TaxID=990650 RepID=A0A0C9W4N1_SPHS4|nr:hypothetical protein M422DRAFT_28663 [Sphaerobolus stellatus SS14]